jgi:hypothetical protein
MTTKLAIYNADLNKETLAIYIDDNQQNKFRIVCQLREMAKDESLNGWINEYDLSWSTTQCANKHDL